MISESMIELYCKGKALSQGFSIDTNPNTVLENLTNTGINYSWETIRDERIDNNQSVIEVNVYLPGNILRGRHVYKTEAAMTAHLHAISNALKLVIKTNKTSNTVESPVEPFKETPVAYEQTVNVPSVIGPIMKAGPLSSESLSPDEIMNIVQQNAVAPQETKITTVQQFNNDKRSEIPFDDVDLDTSQLDNLIKGTTTSTAQPQGKLGFTQEQIQAINEFKQKFSITSDEVLGNYINAWDNKYSRKEDLTPDNINSFLAWTLMLGKAPC